jgi:SAM-dependent methyltransferase
MKTRKFFGQIYTILASFGFDLISLKNAIKGLYFYIRDLKKLKEQRANDRKFYFGKYFPIFHERFAQSGTMSGHYFHQDLHIARRIYINNPVKHLDIGSRMDGFVAHVSIFREIEVVDIREQLSTIQNVLFRRADLMELPEDMIDKYESISSLHAIEHFGLGRYGDPVDYNGHLKAIENITKILKKGGKFYFSVPIGLQRIEFNAHRVFSVQYLLNLFENNFKLEYFSFVNDNGDLLENVALNKVEIDRNYGCKFGCGIFELTKK